MYSFLHQGQKSGNRVNLVSGRTFVFVCFPHAGQQTNPFSLTCIPCLLGIFLCRIFTGADSGGSGTSTSAMTHQATKRGDTGPGTHQTRRGTDGRTRTRDLRSGYRRFRQPMQQKGRTVTLPLHLHCSSSALHRCILVCYYFSGPDV